MNVLLNGPVAATGTEILRRRFGDRLTLLAVDPTDSDEQRTAKFEAAEVLVTVGFDRDLPPTPYLRLIHVPAAGLDEVDATAVPAGVALCNAFEHEIGICEYVIAGMLHCTLDLAGRDARFKAGSWADSPRRSAPFRPELAGRTLGCVGFGHIGQAVARTARTLGMQIMAITQSSRPEPMPDWLGGPDDLPALLQAADFVLLACPLNEATRGLIGAAELEAMAPHAVLINVARGPVVDEAALFTALRDDLIGGAVLDTWWRYPSADDPAWQPAEHPFHELDNVVMTPHCSGWTDGLMERRFGVIGDNIERLRLGRPLINQVVSGA